MPRRSWTPFALATLLLAAFLGLLAGSTTSESVQDDVRVLLVHLHPSVDASGARVGAELDAFRLQHALEGDLSLQARVARRQSVRSVISGRVQDVQAAVKRFIESNSAGSVKILPLWIQNTLVVRISKQDDDSRAHRLWRFFEQELRWFPGVLDVEADSEAVWLISADEDAATRQDEREGGDPEAQGNIKLLHAPELWAHGVRGKDVVVGSIDSGVRYTHEALKSTFRGSLPNGSVSFDYAFWFIPGTDVSRETPDTADEVGHGTHTVGTAVGGNGIGVAPEATWIAARAFDVNGAANKSDFLLAAQWVICPTRTDGSGENCSKGADVLVNSFGIDRSDADFAKWRWMDKVVHVWQAAGIYPIFASGNTNGFLCGSVYYPASRVETIAVGALMGHSLWGASGKGPSVDPGSSNVIIKPDFVAPGVAIRSALSTTDSSYTRMTGTSMATPHIAGAIALLLSIPHTGLSQELWHRQPPSRHPPSPKLIGALQSSTSRDLGRPFLVPSECGNTTYKQYPNNIYGWGLANVCAAANSLGVACSSQHQLLGGDNDSIAIATER